MFTTKKIPPDQIIISKETLIVKILKSFVIISTLLIHSVGHSATEFEESDAMFGLSLASTLMVIGDLVDAQDWIFDAIKISKNEGNSHDLGISYATYGRLLKSNQVSQGKQADVFKEKGFADKSVTLENRFEKSKQYYRMAIDELKKSEDTAIQKQQAGILASSIVNISDAYNQLGDIAQSCSYLVKTKFIIDQLALENPDLFKDRSKAWIPGYAQGKMREKKCPNQ